MTDLQLEFYSAADRFDFVRRSQAGQNFPDQQQLENISRLLWIAHDSLPSIAEAAGECTVNPEFTDVSM